MKIIIVMVVVIKVVMVVMIIAIISNVLLQELIVVTRTKPSIKKMNGPQLQLFNAGGTNNEYLVARAS